jgi:FkbM family methyltransferase
MFLSKLIPKSWKEKVRRRAGAVTLTARLENLRNAGFSPKSIIDAGAFHGEWALTALEIFRGATVLMIEPQPQLAPRLSELSAQTPNLRFRSALLGAERKKTRFLLGETNSHIVPESYVAAAGDRIHELETETLEEIAKLEGFQACDLLKLDLQGHELETLAGAGDIFGRAEVILTEVSWLRIGDVPLVHEVCEVLHGRGYRLYDVLGFNYRPLDRALWQSDLIFVRRDSALLAREHRWA